MKDLVLIILIFSNCIGLNAQDFIFTQFEKSTLLLGPQMAVSNDAIAFQYRIQSLSNFELGFSDYSLAFNKKLPLGTQLIGIGMSIAYGKYGEAWKDKSAAISIAHQLNLVKRDSLAINLNYGAEAKYQNSSIKESDLIWPSRFPHNGYEDILDANYLDLSFGTALVASYKKSTFQLGYTLLHANQPQIKFIKTSFIRQIRHLFFIVGNVPISSAINLIPKIAYSKINGFNYYNTGLNMSYAISRIAKLLIGGGKTTNQYYLFTGVNFKQYNVGLSYEFPNSQLNFENSAVEVSFNYKFGNNSKY